MTSPLLALFTLCALHANSVFSLDIALCKSACNMSGDQTGEGTMLIKHMCGCVGAGTFDPFFFLDTTTTPGPTLSMAVRAKLTTAATTVTTTNICDYLCLHQIGGDACRCSNPSLPGK